MRTVLALLSSVAITLGAATASNSAENDPLHIIVSLKEQHMKVFRGTDLVSESKISSGKNGHATPTGVFSVLQKNRHHRSNIYSNAPMPFMQRLTWSGIALHASNNVPNRPASHGCVRMPYAFARELFKMKTRGTHVIVEDEPREPQVIESRFLLQPEKIHKVSRKHDTWINERIRHENRDMVDPNTRYASRILITRRTYKEDLFDAQRLLNKLDFNAGDVDGIMGPSTWGAIVRFQEAANLKPDGKIDNTLLEVLYRYAQETRPKNGRILVRQHHKTIFEDEVAITEPEKPLGSHLLTATNFDAEKSDTDWLFVSLNDRVHRDINLRSGDAIDPTSARRSIHDSLTRIEMDKRVRRQISRLLTPGSSIAISDNGLSIETGNKGTDFIVLTKPESQNQALAQITD
ncbi:MAG: L,D-transpeptidase [Pseudomonadota bacterium]